MGDENAFGIIIGGGFFPYYLDKGHCCYWGALGGAAGGMLGGQFGFFFSIAGTTIGSALDNFCKR
ncbi:MAG: hypothetical protein CM15mV142_690 [Caudoviricetes sp.]|nr:MAG: hypothetical protein CM15mV142_690 [Caudoviricetes sp.]